MHVVSVSSNWEVFFFGWNLDYQRLYELFLRTEEKDFLLLNKGKSFSSVLRNIHTVSDNLDSSQKRKPLLSRNLKKLHVE